MNPQTPWLIKGYKYNFQQPLEGHLSQSCESVTLDSTAKASAGALFLVSSWPRGQNGVRDKISEGSTLTFSDNQSSSTWNARLSYLELKGSNKGEQVAWSSNNNNNLISEQLLSSPYVSDMEAL